MVYSVVTPCDIGMEGHLPHGICRGFPPIMFRVEFYGV